MKTTGNFMIRVILGLLFLFIVILIIEDPLNIFDIFDNPGRIQLFIVIGLVVLINSSYLIINKINLGIFKTIVFISGYLVMFILIYFLTALPDEDKFIKTLDDFKVIMNTSDYSISKANKIDNLDVFNNDIYVAEKDNIKVYYIYNKRRNKISKTYDSFNTSNHSDCNTGWSSTVSGGKKIVYCEDPSYYRTAYKIKNTMIYASSKYESKDEVEGLLYRLGYHK